MRVVALGFFAALAVFFVFGIVGGAQEKKDEPKKVEPKYTIKEVMKKAHQSKLVQKAIKGEADEKEMKQLVEYYVALGQNTPPKGEADAWKIRTAALLDAAQKNDHEALKKASNCVGCHKDFKK